jgi:transcriptional regulator with XRE-family HTH domain
MSFSKRLLAIRKEKGLSQSELADKVDSTSITIGRYERDEVKPSVEVAAKIAAVLGTSLDYLAGLTDNLVDAATLNKILDIHTLQEDDRKLIMATIDALLRDAKVRNAHK